MKVLFVNNFYYERGDDEKSLFNTAHLLEQNNHLVYFMSSKHRSNRRYLYEKYFVSDINFSSRTISDGLKGLARLYYNYEVIKKAKALLKRLGNVDLVHFNNIMYRLGPCLIRFSKRKN